MAVMAGAAMLVGCNKEVDLGPAKLALDQTTLAFEAAGGSQTLNVTATRDWAVSGVPEWVALSATNGKAAVEAQPVKITVAQNAEYNRSATIVFTIGFARTSLTINQAGPEGEIDNGDGTLENPFNVAGVFEYMDELGAGVVSPSPVFVKGKISYINEAFSSQFGNATFWISDDGDNHGISADGKKTSTPSSDFYCFRVKYLGNQKFTDGQTQIEVGDDVIIYGNVIFYNGQTPETNQNSAFLYSLNGVDKGGAEGGGEAKGDGSLENPFNPAGITAVAEKLDDNAVSPKSYYMKGKISRIAVSKNVEQTFTNNVDYGNASFYIVDAEDGTGEFYIYQTYYLGNRKWVTGDTDIKVGDEVIVYGPVTKYVSQYGTTLETSGKGASYIYSLNGVSDGGGDQPGGEDYSSAAAKTVAEFIQLADKNTYYKLTGTVSNFNPTYCSFNLTDASGTIYVYSVLDAYKTDEWKNKIKNGGTITIAGKYDYYSSKQQHEVVNAAFLEYTDGEGGEPGGGDQPGGGDGNNVSFDKSQLAAAADNGATVAMNDVISFTNSSNYNGTAVTELRIYKSQTFTVSAASGYVVTKIEFTCTASGTTKQGPGCWGAGAPAGYSYDDKNGVWEGSSNSVAFTATDNQVRIVSLKVTYAAQ